MAVYRMVHISYWQDRFVLDLTPEEKYFYLYLLTNSKTTQCGIYELPKKIIELETGYNRETVDKLLRRFVDYGKIEYSEETKEIFIKNWLKHNSIKSEKVQKCVEKEVKEIKNKPFISALYRAGIDYGYPMDSLSIDYGEKEEKEKEKQEEKEQIPFAEIIGHLNSVCSTRFKLGQANKSHVRARWNEGYTLDDFKTVIDKKAREWLGTEQAKYLRPETLFGTKFDTYLNQIETSGKSKTEQSLDEFRRWAEEHDRNEGNTTYYNVLGELPSSQKY